MTNKKFSGLSLFLILAVIFSMVTVITPALPVQAASTSVTIHFPTADNITYVKGSGYMVPVYYRLEGSGTDSNAVQISIYNSAGSIGTGSASQASGADYTIWITLTGGSAGTFYNVSVSDGNGHIATVYNAVYIDTMTPSLSVYTSSTCWKTSSSQTIYYTATIPGAPSENFSSLVIAFNGSAIPGGTFTNVSQTTSGSVPYTAVTSGTITITGTSAAGTSGSATSSLITVLSGGTIFPSAPSLSATAFNGGSLGTISFTVSGTSTGTSFSYLLALNKGDGTTENITPGWYSSSGTSVNYTWTVPNDVTSTNCSVTVWTQDCAGNISAPFTSTTFSITSTATTTVTITSPASGTTWYSGTSENITWTVSDPLSSATHACVVYWSTSDNTTWPYPNTAIITAQGNSGSSYWATWSIPAGTNSSNCEICISAQAPSSTRVGYGYSGIFTVYNLTNPPTVTISSPYSTSSWTAGSTQSVQWTTSGTPTNAPMDYKVYLTYNGSIIVDTAISSATDGAIATRYNQLQGTSTYSWTLPSSYPTIAKPGPYTIRVVAAYYAGPGPQEQLPIQVDSSQFTITAMTTPCNTTAYNITLYPGWNLISPQSFPANTDVNSMLGSVMSNVLSVYNYTPSTGWQYFIPATGTGTLTSIADGKGYWVQMSQSTSPSGVTMTYQGRKTQCGTASPASYYYTAGWNLIGFKSEAQMPFSQYFPYTCGSISTPYQAPLLGYDGQHQTGASVYCTDNLTPGKGYWLYVGTAFGLIPPQ